MNVKARGTVTLPRRPFSGLAILPWCREVNRSLQQLRDRTTSVPASGRKAGGTAPTGAFYRVYTVASEDATNGDIMLQGGQVAAGSGNASVADFLLYDISATTWAGTAGQFLQLTVNGDGSSEDGILMPTFDLTSVTGPAAVASIAANTLPIVGTLGGVCRISLGTFGDDSFAPALPGNINVSFCFGGFTITRF